MISNADLNMFTLYESDKYLIRFNGCDGILNNLQENKFTVFSVFGSKGQLTVAYKQLDFITSEINSIIIQKVENTLHERHI